MKAEREKKREDINKKLGKSLQEDGNSGSSSKKTRIQHPNSKTQLVIFIFTDFFVILSNAVDCSWLQLLRFFEHLTDFEKQGR